MLDARNHNRCQRGHETTSRIKGQHSSGTRPYPEQSPKGMLHRPFTDTYRIIQKIAKKLAQCKCHRNLQKKATSKMQVTIDRSPSHASRVKYWNTSFILR